MSYQRIEIPESDIQHQLDICAQLRAHFSAGGRQPLAMVDTYGCQQNESDSEVLRGYLRSMGYTMTDDEDNSVVAAVVKQVAGRVPVIAGSGSNSTQTMLTKSLTYQGLGADGLLLITPYYNKSNEEGIYQHFKTVADAVDIPCILYNIPGRCGCGISEHNVERLAAHPNIMGIKEASGNVAYAAKIAHLLSDDFRMYSGEDALTVPLMSLGASGTISVWADVQPQLVHDMCRAYLDGDVARARDIQIAGQPLINALFSEVNPIPVKEALAQMGMIEANYRMPLCPMANDTRSALTDALKGAGLLD